MVFAHCCWNFFFLRPFDLDRVDLTRQRPNHNLEVIAIYERQGYWPNRDGSERTRIPGRSYLKI